MKKQVVSPKLGFQKQFNKLKVDSIVNDSAAQVFHTVLKESRLNLTHY